MAKKLISDYTRFMRSFKQVGDCWEWQLFKDWDGYGKFTIKRPDGLKRSTRAHRWSYEFFRRSIVPGLQIDHLCRNRACVNPLHLDVVTSRENTQRGWRKNKTMCKHGHPLAGDNLIVQKDGKRNCRECRNRLAREHGHRTGWAASKKYRERLKSG